MKSIAFLQNVKGKNNAGQRAQIQIDLCGSRKEFEGRITGFALVTG